MKVWGIRIAMVDSKRKYSNSDGTLNIQSLRSDFPVLSRSIRGKKLVYLDNAATALKPLRVIESLERYYRQGTANIHRGVHLLSEEATTAYEQVRDIVAQFVQASDQKEIIFTSGTTAGINLVAMSFVKPMLSPGDEILISYLEHHANIVPWQMLCEQTGAKLKIMPISESGDIDMDQCQAMINSKTKFMSVSWVSNAIGTVNPIDDIVRLANGANIPILVDAAQAVAHFPVNLQRLKADFLVFSGHKLFGPTGVGVLFGRTHHLESMRPIFGGGDMIKTVSFEKTVYADIPARFEAGTPPIADVIALGEAIKFVTDDIGFDRIAIYEDHLLKLATTALRAVSGLRIIGNAKIKVPVVSFILDNIHAHDIGSILDQHGVAVRTGHHCAEPLLKFFGVPATARASFSIINDEQDVEALVRSLLKAKELFA